MTHDPLCAKSPTGVHYIGTCTCDLIARVVEREESKYLPMDVRGDDHVDWCRDLYCYGCKEITE